MATMCTSLLARNKVILCLSSWGASEDIDKAKKGGGKFRAHTRKFRGELFNGDNGLLDLKLRQYLKGGLL
jgi:hypothetical protein